MWQKTNNKLYRKFTLGNFKQAVDLINDVAQVADEINHHPTIKNTYNTVEIWLSTHDAGNKVTDKDHELAKRIDKLLDKQSKTSSTSAYKKLKLYSDGGSRGNPGPSASGYVLMTEDDTIVLKSGVYLGVTTNNQAEYQSLKFGLEEAKKLGAREVKVYMDSLLVINQMKGVFKVKNRDLWPIHEAIKDLATHFKSVSYNHVPRELNKLADGEVNEVLDNEENS